MWKGKYKYDGRALAIDLGRNWLSGCRDNELMHLFLDDLERGRKAYIENNRLHITLVGSEGIMYLDRVK